LQLAWLKGQIDTMWNEASPDIQATYGKAYFEGIHAGAAGAAKEAAKSMWDVIEAMEDAVVNLSPQIRYLVDGSSKIIDLNNVGSP